jgi:hypothetical protein
MWLRGGAQAPPLRRARMTANMTVAFPFARKGAETVTDMNFS